MTARRKGLGWMGWTLIIIAGLALAGFGLWRWATATGSADTLEWIDARFARDVAVERRAAGNYGKHPALRGEIWVPGSKPGGSVPLVVFIHGGGWHSGAPESYRFVARTLGEHGIATALVGYRLVPEGRYPAMLEDSAAAVRWVRDNAAKAGVAADQMVLAGHSAGAYNVLMLGLDPQWLEQAGAPQSSVAGIVSLAGPADFYPFDKDSSRNAFGHTQEPELTQPVAFARADAPPVLLMHGLADTVVRPYNSQNLHKAIRAAGGASELVEYPDMGHAGIVMGLSKPFAQGGKVRDPLLAFIRDASLPVQGTSR